MLSIHNVSYTYKGKNASPVLRGIDLDMTEGFTFLVGENGSGKTTLIKLITGIFPLQGGSIEADGAPAGSNAYRKRLAYLPQVFDIYPSLRVRETLCFIAGLKGIPDRGLEAEISRVAQETGIESFLGKKMKQCSEGMRRRVGIASTLIGDPEIVIMDEPTAGVDPKERLAFYKVVKECFGGKTVLISTHVLSDVDYLADRVAMLSSGKLAYSGSYGEFRHSLDGKIYSLSVTAGELDGLKEKFTVLSTEKDGEKYVCHVMPGPGASPEGLPPAEANMEDIWLYYERTV